jgi:hypothetical protein
MTRLDSRARLTQAPSVRVVAGACAALLLALAAPALSLLPALTTGLRGSAPAVSFPHGYAVTLIATVAVTAAACALGGFISHRAGLVTIPLGLGLWAIAGLGVIAAGLSLGHAHLADWGIVLLTAVAAGAGAGLLAAAR